MRRPLAILSLLFATASQAQQQPRPIVVEHFTNTWCSVCAGRNPGFLANLAQTPDVLHLGIYPSAPYKGCPLSQYATTDQDARTKRYGIYGSTPRHVVNGEVIDAATNYNSPAIFDAARGGTSSFELRLGLQRVDSTTGSLRALLYKRDTSSLDSLLIYGLLTQDTVDFAAKNGEQLHYDVFRKSVWGTDPRRIAVPRNLGDSAVFTTTFAIDAAWPASRIFATVLLQHPGLKLEQAARSRHCRVTNPLPAARIPLRSWPIRFRQQTGFISTHQTTVTSRFSICRDAA